MKQYLLLILCLCILACGKEEEGCAPSNVASNSAETLIKNYIAEKGLSPELNNEGLYYIITNPGSAEKPTLDDQVEVIYRGYYRNDCEFDSSSGSSVSFGLSGLIEAWRIGIPLLGKGGTMMMIVPPSLGYGGNPPRGIKGGEPLMFDIELVNF